ncbi:hypothetical protein GN956_G5626 [Arapaima gigas]
MIPALFLCLLLCSSPSLSSDPRVLQNPHHLLLKAGAKVNLSCSMATGVSMSSYTMLWYRQGHSGRAVEFLKTQYDQAGEGDHFKVSISTNENKFGLQINGVTANDSATYYCAASHSAAGDRGVCARSREG